MTFTRRSFEPNELSPAELVHVQTNVNEGDTLESYKRERAEREHYKCLSDMRHVGFGSRYGVCG